MEIRRPLCAVSVFFLLFIWIILELSGDYKRIGKNDYDIYNENGRKHTFTCTVKRIEIKHDKIMLYLKNISFTDVKKSDNTDQLSSYPKVKTKYGIIMYLPLEAESLEAVHIGSKIYAKGQFSCFEHSYNEGEFDFRKYYFIKGYRYVLYNGSIDYVSKEYDKCTDWLYRIKESTKKIYKTYLDGENAGIIESICLGDKSELDEEIKMQYRDAGISHILALSGLHIATVGFMIYAALRMIIRKYPAAIVSILIMSGYAVMTGMNISTVRALIMFWLGIVADIIGRTYDLMTGAAIAADIIVIGNPYYIYDSGFLLSFAAVCGIGILYTAFRQLYFMILGKRRVMNIRHIKAVPVRLVIGICKSLGFGIVIQLATIPFTIWFFNQISIYGIFANLVVIPLATLVLMLGIILAVFGNLYMLFESATLLESLAKVSAKALRAVLQIYRYVTEVITGIDSNIKVCARPNTWQMIVYYVLILGVVIILEAEYINYKKKKVFAYEKSVLAIITLILIASILVIFKNNEKEYEISSLYVGQGQCFIIHGKNIPTIMYDCGSTDKKDIAKYTLIPYLKSHGIDQIDAVIVSHMDKDHMSGVIGLLNSEESHIDIEGLIVGENITNLSSDNFEELMSAANRKRIKVYTMKKGDRIDYDLLHITCLSPEVNEIYDINEGSLVVAVEYDKSDNGSIKALFTGDINERVEKMLIEEGIGTYDFVQIPHHGSATAAYNVFYSRIRPRIAVISAGLNNRYGHPHLETMEILDKAENLNTYTLFKTGETDLYVERSKAYIKTYNQ